MYIATENIEPINHINIVLDPRKHALAYAQRKANLIKMNLSLEEVENILKEPIQMEVYYDADADSIFMLESKAVEELDPTDLFNPYNSETLNDPLAKDDSLRVIPMRDEINAIVSAYGSVQFGQLQLDSHPVYGEGENTISFVEGISFDKITIVQYDKQTNEVVDEHEINLSLVTNQPFLDQIHSIAMLWMAENE